MTDTTDTTQSDPITEVILTLAGRPPFTSTLFTQQDRVKFDLARDYGYGWPVGNFSCTAAAALGSAIQHRRLSELGADDADYHARISTFYLSEAIAMVADR